MADIELGQEVKDRVTGYVGIAVSATKFLQGCDRYGVQQKFDPEKDSKIADIEMFDEIDLEVIGCGILSPPPESTLARRGGNPNFRPMRTR